MYNATKIFYLKDATNLQELKSLYLSLVKKYHPDINPLGLEQMKIINNEYDYLKTILKNATDTKKAEQENINTMDGFKDLLEKIMQYKNLKIELIGSWAWISGNGTFSIKQEILYDILHIGYSKSNKKFYWYKGIDCINGRPQQKIKGGFLKEAINKYGITEILTDKNKTFSLC